jgi:hypothetical protein
MCNPQLFTPFMACKGLFHYFEESIMDDIVSFGMPVQKQKLKSDNCFGHPIVFRSLRVLWPQVLLQLQVQL